MLISAPHTAAKCSVMAIALFISTVCSAQQPEKQESRSGANRYCSAGQCEECPDHAHSRKPDSKRCNSRHCGGMGTLQFRDQRGQGGSPHGSCHFWR